MGHKLNQVLVQPLQKWEATKIGGPCIIKIQTAVGNGGCRRVVVDLPVVGHLVKTKPTMFHSLMTPADFIVACPTFALEP